LRFGIQSQVIPVQLLVVVIGYNEEERESQTRKQRSDEDDVTDMKALLVVAFHSRGISFAIVSLSRIKDLRGHRTFRCGSSSRCGTVHTDHPAQR